MLKNFYFKPVIISLIFGIGLAFSSCGDDEKDEPAAPKSEIKVSPSAELLGTVSSSTTITVNATEGTTWTISGVPDWLSLNRSGIGSSVITITATQENFSDEPRQTVLTFTTDDGTSSASCTVSQKGVLATNCRVYLGDITVMNDGFAADLKFDSNCKGYREAFIFASDAANMTDRDIYNQLMEHTEFSGKMDFACSPICEPGTELIYCIAAYGNETNADGSHKYGPMTIKRITTKERTRSSDMWLTLSHTSSSWIVSAARQGAYGQKCDEYYYFAFEGNSADTYLELTYDYTYAFIAHFYLKPAIAEEPERFYKFGPQTLNFSRESDKFYIATWGKDRDTKEFSAEISWIYKNLTSASSRSIAEPKQKKIFGEENVTRKFRTREDLPELGKITCLKMPLN